MRSRSVPLSAAALLSANLLSTNLVFAFVRLLPETAAAFDRYIELTEAELARNRQLYLSGHPQLQNAVRRGQIAIESRLTTERGRAIDVPNGLIQDWLGMMFIPGATVAQVEAVLQDYEGYRQIYAPEVIESKLKSRRGGEFDVFLRLYKKQILTVVLNTEYRVRYEAPAAGRLYVTSHSTRVAEVKNPRESYTEEEPAGNDSGFLWRINAYWNVEQAPGGVYAELRAVSLSRDVPLGLGWMAGGFVQKFPRESMLNTLRATRRAVEARAGVRQSGG